MAHDWVDCLDGDAAVGAEVSVSVHDSWTDLGCTGDIMVLVCYVVVDAAAVSYTGTLVVLSAERVALSAGCLLEFAGALFGCSLPAGLVESPVGLRQFSCVKYVMLRPSICVGRLQAQLC